MLSWFSRLSTSSLIMIFCLGMEVSSAYAQDATLLLPPEGTTIISLSATQTKKVPQDLLVASLRVELENESASALQSQINESMTKALGIAKKGGKFTISTGAYNVYKEERVSVVDKMTGAHETKTIWRGSQTIDLESKDPAFLLESVGKIQAIGFVMNNLSYTLSRETLDTVQDELLVGALEKLRARAALVSKTLGKSKYELFDVQVDGNAAPPVFYKAMRSTDMAMGAVAEAMPAPVAESGESEVSLSVSARAVIRR